MPTEPPDKPGGDIAPGAMTEHLTDDWGFFVRAARQFERFRSPFQMVEVSDSVPFGKLFRLDGHFMLPLASAIAHSVGPVDMVVWSVIALAVQIVVYFLVTRLVPHFAEAIRAGRVAGATLLAVLAVATGILNAACMTY